MWALINLTFFCLSFPRTVSLRCVLLRCCLKCSPCVRIFVTPLFTRLKVATVLHIWPHPNLWWQSRYLMLHSVSSWLMELVDKHVMRLLTPSVVFVFGWLKVKVEQLDSFLFPAATCQFLHFFVFWFDQSNYFAKSVTIGKPLKADVSQQVLHHHLWCEDSLQQVVHFNLENLEGFWPKLSYSSI